MDIDNSAVDAALTIPAWLKAHMLPAGCSVSELLSCMTRLPTVNPSCVLSQQNSILASPARYLHTTKETFSGDHGHKSFLDWQYNNIPTPFFVIVYWIQQAGAVEEGALWMLAREHVTSLAHHAADIQTAQVATRWDVSVRGVNVDPIVTSRDVQSLLLPGMLGGIIMDGMIRRIRYRQQLSTHLPSPQLSHHCCTEVRVIDTSDQLGYNDLQDLDKYANAQRTQEKSATGIRLATLLQKDVSKQFRNG
ncbi:hypothetical protein BC835DRAFT_1311528 [Cytidiella melzeri]|nr:hypothetical protein BC835DRAFT_1311528 [Cytidiella melzeri]